MAALNRVLNTYILYVKPKKHLGQHFLTDLSIAERIAQSLTADNCAKTLEIGPGTGVLTRFLMQNPKLDLSVIEVDTESIAFLKEAYPDFTAKIIEGDFLRMDVARIMDGNFNVIGNFPYNISSQILFRVLEWRDLVPEVVCMLQKEVAVRLAEPPGSRDYGILSVFLQTFYDIEYLFTVDPVVFNPPPKVNSGVIRLTRNDRKKLTVDEKLYFKVVKGTFGQRRKTIRNSLRAAFPQITGDHEYFNLRPECLGVEEFLYLTEWVEQQLAEKQP